jgi:hypothetical protein
MLRLIVTILFLITYHTGIAQELKGMILDNESKSIITGVTILNRHTGMVVFSDTNGNYSIQATAGDTLVFRHAAYLPAREVMTYTLGSRYKSILMLPAIQKLMEATVVAKTKYQQDSTERHEIFNHELTKILVPKPKYTGLACAGCIGWIADKITGNSKKPKQFRKNFAADDQSKFIDSRYTPALVSSLTGINDTDSVAAFIYAYPMEYEFARLASDLEMKIWIRGNYKEYIKTDNITR